MGAKLLKKYRRRIKTKVKSAPFTFALLLLLITGCIVIMNQDRQLSVIPDSYKPLLDLIADVESRDNYNAYFGNAHNSSVDFTKMTIADVMEWQKQQVAHGSPSSAVGRYQIIDTTLAGLVENMKLDPNQLFDEATQDRMAIALLERRGSVSYVNNEMSRDDFAANLAMEWASLPKVTGENPESSYYAGDGLNRSLIDKERVLSAIGSIEPEK